MSARPSSTLWKFAIVVFVISLLLVAFWWPSASKESSGTGIETHAEESLPALVPRDSIRFDGFTEDSENATRDVTGKSPVDMTEIYASEEFIHVPGWLPRPAMAIDGSAVDASLLSNGFQEGTVFYTLAGTPEEVGEWIGMTLAAAGLSPEDGTSVFSSENPQRHCEVSMNSLTDGSVRVRMKYHAMDHEKGCTCVTCDGK